MCFRLNKCARDQSENCALSCNFRSGHRNKSYEKVSNVMMKKLLLVIVLNGLSVVSAFATGQEADRIIYEGKEGPLFSNPLEDYYANGRKRPNFMVKPFVRSSGNWRGYVAAWRIDDGKLYLINIDAWLCAGNTERSCKPVALRQIFPGRVKDGRVLADWFSGELRIPDGKRLQYVHMGYGSTYERDIVFSIEKGIASGPVVLDHTKEELPSEFDSARRELEKLKAAEDSQTKPASQKTKRGPKSGITITPGQGVFRHGIRRKDIEAVVGEGDVDSSFDDVYFVEYPAAGVQVSYQKRKHTVHVIFLYNNASRYEKFIVPKVLTDKGISWDSTDEDVLIAYGKPLKDYGDESKSWRRLEYPGIDFLFGGGKLGRIGILGPDGN